MPSILESERSQPERDVLKNSVQVKSHCSKMGFDKVISEREASRKIQFLKCILSKSASVKFAYLKLLSAKVHSLSLAPRKLLPSALQSETEHFFQKLSVKMQPVKLQFLNVTS